MLSVAQPVHIPLHVDNHQPRDVELNELCDLQDAVEPFAKMIQQSARSSRAVRLHCSVPTLANPSTSFDLHDLHDLQTRSLLFVHNLVETLKASGIPASYRLQLTSCPLSLVCALPPDLDASKMKAAALAAVQESHLRLKGKALLADLKDGLALVIT